VHAIVGRVCCSCDIRFDRRYVRLLFCMSSMRRWAIELHNSERRFNQPLQQPAGVARLQCDVLNKSVWQVYYLLAASWSTTQLDAATGYFPSTRIAASRLICASRYLNVIRSVWWQFPAALSRVVCNGTLRSVCEFAELGCNMHVGRRINGRAISERRYMCAPVGVKCHVWCLL
jgi:hypothetical protein